MSRITASIVVCFMVMIAGSAAVILYVQLQLGVLEAAMAGCTGFMVLALGQIVFERARERRWVESRINEVADVASDASMEASRIGARMAAMDSEFATRVRAEVDPVATEVEVIGSLLRQIAEAVADIDEKVERQRLQPPQVVMMQAPPQMIPQQAMVPPGMQAAYAAAQGTPQYQPQYAPGPGASREPPPRPAQRAGTASRKPATALEKEIDAAIRAERIEIFLQPVVALPQRKVRFYEVHAKVRDSAEEQIAGSVFIPVAERLGLMPRVDTFVFLRAVQIVRRLGQRNRDTGVFVNLSAVSLVDSTFVRELLAFVQANRDIADLMVFEFAQAAWQEMGAIEQETVAAMRDAGLKFSIDGVTDLTVNFSGLAARGVRYMKIAAERLLRREALVAGDIHPEDVSTLIARHGLELIADRMEREAQVVELLDYDIRFGQGFLFSVPRPVRPEVFVAMRASPAPAQPAAAAPAAPVRSAQQMQTPAARIAAQVRPAQPPVPAVAPAAAKQPLPAGSAALRMQQAAAAARAQVLSAAGGTATGQGTRTAPRSGTAAPGQ